MVAGGHSFRADRGERVRNRYYHKPVIFGDLHFKKPLTLDMWKYAQSLTSRPVKGMVTGPYTMVDWAFEEYYPTRTEIAIMRVPGEVSLPIAV